MQRPWYFRWVSVLILLAGFAVRVWKLGSTSLWIDEVFTDLWSRADAHNFFPMIFENGTLGPFYFILNRLFPHNNELMLRLPSLLMGLFSIALFMFVVQRWYKQPNLTLIAGALLAFNPYHVWMSRVARPYAIMFLLSLLASYFFLELLNGKRTRTNWIGFVVASACAYSTHYYAAMLPMTQYILFAFVLRSNRYFFRRWMLAQIIAVIPLMIWIVALMRQDAVALGIGWIPKPEWQDLIRTLWNMTIGYDGAIAPEGQIAWYAPFGFLIAVIGLVWGGVYALRHRQQRAHYAEFYWLIMILATMIATLVVSAFRPLYVDRYFIVFSPALLMLMLVGWQNLPWARVRTAAALLTIAICMLNITVVFYRDDHESDDWNGVAQYIDQNYQAGDGLLFYTPIELYATLRYSDLSMDVPTAWLENAPDPAEQYHTEPTRIWLVFRDRRSTVHRLGAMPDIDPQEPNNTWISDWLTGRDDQIVSTKVFNGVAVILLDLSR
jgi:mannosyltransferase